MRYQDSPWWVRWFRRRYYLLVPFETLWIWATQQEDPEWHFDLLTCWSISTGIAQSRMDWYYTMEETMERLKRFKE